MASPSSEAVHGRSSLFSNLGTNVEAYLAGRILKHLFSTWSAIVARLTAAGHVLLLSDFDGTLVPIVDKPEMAHLSGETRDVLHQLSGMERYTVGIISGRSLRDLKERVGLADVLYVGNHGLEIEAPGVSFVSPVGEELRPLLNQISVALGEAVADIPGAIVEHRGLIIGIHYRLVAPDRVGDVKKAFQEITREPCLQGRVRTTEGKKLYEVRPAVDWDKGKAIEVLMENFTRAHGHMSVLPMYFGDDNTDEDGFKVVGECGGLSIFVGEEGHPTVARYRLESPGEMWEFLRRLLCLDAEE